MGKIWVKKLIRSEESKRYWEKYVEENWEEIKKEHRAKQKRIKKIQEIAKDIIKIEEDIERAIEGREAKELAGDKDFIGLLENTAKLFSEEKRGLLGVIYNYERLIPEYKNNLDEEEIEIANIKLNEYKRRMEYIETVEKRINKKIAGALQEYNKEHNENYSSFMDFALKELIRNYAESEYAF